MKTKLILLIISILIFSNAFAQNYELIKPNEVQLFRIDSSYWKDVYQGSHIAIKIDSIAVQGFDTIYYLPKSKIRLSDFEWGCFYYGAPVWFGNKIIKKADGSYIFELPILDDSYSDPTEISYFSPLRFQPNIWTYDTLGLFVDSVNHKAWQYSLLNIDTATVLGILDSIKTFVVFHQYNSDYLIISKNQGLIRIPSIFYGDEIGFGYAQNITRVPNEVLTKRRIYDFSIGDVFHIQVTHNFHYYSHGYYYKSIRITDTLHLNNEKDLRIKYIESKIDMWPLPPIVTTENKEMTIYNIDSTLYDGVPKESIFAQDVSYPDRYFCSYFDLYTKPEQYNGRYCLKALNMSISKDRLYGSNLKYYDYKNFEGLWPIIEYHDNDIEGNPGDRIERIIYYKKGNEEWGTPIAVASMEDLIKTKTFKIYPNPSNGQFQIQFNEINSKNASISIFDLTGKSVYQKTVSINKNSTQLNLTELPKGVYFLKIKTEQSEEIEKFFITK